jgi:hypothetical protein
MHCLLRPPVTVVGHRVASLTLCKVEIARAGRAMAADRQWSFR